MHRCVVHNKQSMLREYSTMHLSCCKGCLLHSKHGWSVPLEENTPPPPHRADGCRGCVQQLPVGSLVGDLVKQVQQVHVARQRAAPRCIKQAVGGTSARRP